MSKVRPRSVRLWPLVCAAALCWLAWVLSAQSPVTWRPTDQLYITAQRGCVGVWYWSPAERSTLGLHDRLTFSVGRHETLANLPFLWRDAWGYGIGTPLWIPALILTALAARRYAVTSVRDAPPTTRSARRWAVVWLCLFGGSTLGMFLSAGHRTEPVVTLWGRQVNLENGAFVVENAKTPAAPTPFTVTFGAVARTPSPYVDESPQGSWYIDILPDWISTATNWRLALPLWPLVIVTGWLAWRARRAAAFKGTGLCSNCGYNLAGLTAGCACPECGTAQRVVSS